MMSPVADALGQFLIALAGSDHIRLSDAACTFLSLSIIRQADAGAEGRHMVVIAQRLWSGVRSAEAAKLPSSVAWRLALTAIEEGLERYLEELHRQSEPAEG